MSKQNLGQRNHFGLAVAILAGIFNVTAAAEGCSIPPRNEDSLTSVPTVELCAEAMSLQRNFITSLGAHEFTNYTFLTSVDLRTNQLTSDGIDPKAFCGGVPIASLYFMENNLTRIPDLMCLNDTLELLAIGGQRTALPRVDFGELNSHGKLNELRLNRDQLEFIHPDALCGTVLATLNLSENKISLVPNVKCIGSTLVEIRLNANQICSLSKGAFQNFTALNYIDLNNNCLVDVWPIAALATSPVTKIYLAQNQIINVGNIFDDFTTLKQIRLERNQLKCFIIVSISSQYFSTKL